MLLLNFHSMVFGALSQSFDGRKIMHQLIFARHRDVIKYCKVFQN